MSNKAPLITKSDFIRYLDCPLYAWLWKNRPDLREGHQNSRIADQGYEVEKLAQQLLSGDQYEYQKTAETERYLARADIMKQDGEKWHIYEVKSSTNKKKEHLADLSFQLVAFREAGFEIASINLVHVNGEYLYLEEKGLELKKFFTIEDLTEEIEKKAEEFRPQIEGAYKILTSDSEPKVPALKKKFKYPLPQKFAEYYRRGIPEYSIYDLSRINKKKLETLTSMNILQIKDVPDDFKLSDNQNLQVRLTKQETNFIDKDGIKEELASLEYPLYFLDYETINPAIPFLDKQKPHKHVTFQYSLHVMDKPGAEPKHFEFLHTEKSNPTSHLLAHLSKNIGNKGSIIVWHKSFERGCNIIMAETCPEYQGFIESVNQRLYDLELVFKDKYVDYRFMGRTSIKKVLPILVPELNYNELDIQHGGMAMDAILDLIEGKVENPNILAGNLKTYCELDTLAMVKIFERLKNL